MGVHIKLVVEQDDEQGDEQGFEVEFDAPGVSFEVAEQFSDWAAQVSNGKVIAIVTEVPDAS